MEIVSLKDIPATYATTWLQIANTEGYDQIHINDEFKENGTVEIFAVENLMPSSVAGASRLLMRRGEHASQVETHRAGAVLTRIEKEVVPVTVHWVEDALNPSKGHDLLEP